MDIVNRDRAAPFTTKDGSTIREILAPRNSVIARQSLAEATLPTGQTTEAHRHPATEEIYYVLRGEGLIRLGDEERAIGPGDGVAIAPGTPHQIRNTGAADLVFLCCCVPAYEDDDTVMVAPLFVGDI